MSESKCEWKTPPSKEPIEIPKRNGMVISTSGVLLRCKDACAKHSDTKYLCFGLETLVRHIEELRENPTPENVGEFLSLWVK